MRHPPGQDYSDAGLQMHDEANGLSDYLACEKDRIHGLDDCYYIW